MSHCFNPLEQFSIFSTKSCLTSNFTNLLIVHFILILAGLYFSTMSVYIKNSIQLAYWKILDLVKISYIKNTKLKTAVFLPVFFFVFLIVIINNLCGLIPYSYAITSALIFDFYIVLTMFGVINLTGIIYHRWNFFNLFMPKGLTLTFSWFIIFFETVSYIARIFSLTIRLFANILSGHILQHILMTFSFKLFFISGLAGYLFLIPWIITFLVTGLEVAICILQAYVLLILLLIYFGNVINLH